MKDEIIKISKQTERIKRETKELGEELEKIDNEFLVKKAERLANEKSS